MKNKYNFILRKTQDAIVEIECDSEINLGQIAAKIEEMSEEELNFYDPQYDLIAVSINDKKLSKIVWRSKNS